MIKVVGRIDLGQFASSRDVLGELEPLFEDEVLSINGPSKEQKDILYQQFKNDIVLHPPLVDGRPLSYNKSKSSHRDFKNMPEGFVHCITRESKYSKRREFDPSRAQKIHWIKPVIMHAADVRIKYFEAVNDEGQNQKFYWYEAKSFMVIVREISDSRFLITSFDVDQMNKNTYMRQYEAYKRKNPTS